MVNVEAGIHVQCGFEDPIEDITRTFGIVGEEFIRLDASSWEFVILVSIFGESARLIECSDLSNKALVQAENCIVL
jgi:hypothetical protein